MNLEGTADCLLALYSLYWVHQKVKFFCRPGDIHPGSKFESAHFEGLSIGPLCCPVVWESVPASSQRTLPLAHLPRKSPAGLRFCSDLASYSIGEIGPQRSPRIAIRTIQTINTLLEEDLLHVGLNPTTCF